MTRPCHSIDATRRPSVGLHSTKASIPIVFVHGLLGTFHDPDVLRYYKRGSVLAPDLLGYGSLSQVPDHTITLSSQVAHLESVIRRSFGSDPVHIVGHSVGGVIAALFTYAHGERVCSFVSVEGNFTLKDAFWSSSIARMTQDEVDQKLLKHQQNPGAWLTESGIDPEPRCLRIAAHWLARQPASTLRAMSKSVVDETGSQEYLQKLRAVFDQHPVHLIAGERSRRKWDVPGWARQEAASLVVIPKTGHLMMIEKTTTFAGIVSDLLRP